MSTPIGTDIYFQYGTIFIADVDGISKIPLADWPVVRDEIDRMIADANAPDQRSQRAQEGSDG